MSFTSKCPACDETINQEARACACGWKNPRFLRNEPVQERPVPMTLAELAEAEKRTYGQGQEFAHEVQKIRAGLRPQSEWPSSAKFKPCAE